MDRYIDRLTGRLIDDRYKAWIDKLDRGWIDKLDIERPIDRYIFLYDIF